MSGVAVGAGKQPQGFVINLAAHWGIGIPTALLLGFHFKLGVEGLYAGVMLGPMMQFIGYSVLVSRLDWKRESEVACARVAAAAESQDGAGI